MKLVVEFTQKKHVSFDSVFSYAYQIAKNRANEKGCYVSRMKLYDFRFDENGTGYFTFHAIADIKPRNLSPYGKED